MTARSRWRRQLRRLIDLFRHPVTYWLVWREKSDERQKSKAERQSKYDELSRLWEFPPSLPSTGYNGFLVEAYKKHSTELASIEDRLNKLLLVILGVFGAGATAISKVNLMPVPAWILVVVVLVFAGFGLHYNHEIRDLRTEVRYLLVRCEIEMGFYSLPKDSSKYLILANKQLYSKEELDFPKKGNYLRVTYTVAIIAAAAGLILLIYVACPQMLHPSAPASTFAPF